MNRTWRMVALAGVAGAAAMTLGGCIVAGGRGHTPAVVVERRAPVVIGRHPSTVVVDRHGGGGRGDWDGRGGRAGRGGRGH